jgi:glycosyltransferase involved in cell wall biosynthesis
MAGIAPGFQRQECPHKEFTFAEQIGLKEQVERLQPDLVHFTMVQQPVWLNPAIPVVTTMHDLTTARFRNPAKNAVTFTLKQQVYKWLNRRVARRSAAIITPSDFVRQDVASFCGIATDKITITYEAADDLPLPAKPVDGLEGREFIVYVGRPTPHKNLERLIEAFATLQKSHTDLRLVLAGKKDVNYTRIESLVKQRGIENVVFTDFITDNQLRWLYERCQAYVFPSLSEGFGLPGLEAMRHGAPVVSSNATCLPEIYGDAALYFNPTDVSDMAAKIQDAVGDSGLRQDIIRKGHIQAEKYSWRRMAEQTLAVYDSILR